MSDIKLYNFKDKKQYSPQKSTLLQIQQLITENIKELLGVTLIANNYFIAKGNNDIIQTLGFDENYTIVVIEYRLGKFDKLINKGIMFLDYIKENISEFKMLINDEIGVETTKQMSFHPRLIIIGEDFVKYDEHAIKQLYYQIDLIKFQRFNKDIIVLEKIYQSNKLDHFLLKHKFTSRQQHDLFQVISQFILSLGDEVVEVGYSNFICYRKIKTFLYITFDQDIKCSINGINDVFTITDENDFEKIKDKIELAYDQF